MKDVLLYYVAVPCTEEVINIITLFSIDTGEYAISQRDLHKCGLFIYRECLGLEIVDVDTEWLLDNKDAIQVLAFYANKDFDGLCTYLNTIHKRPFNVYVNPAYLI